jgi:hypothetical protein
LGYVHAPTDLRAGTGTTSCQICHRWLFQQRPRICYQNAATTTMGHHRRT